MLNNAFSYLLFLILKLYSLPSSDSQVIWAPGLPPAKSGPVQYNARKTMCLIYRMPCNATATHSMSDSPPLTSRHSFAQGTLAHVLKCVVLKFSLHSACSTRNVSTIGLLNSLRFYHLYFMQDFFFRDVKSSLRPRPRGQKTWHWPQLRPRPRQLMASLTSLFFSSPAFSCPAFSASPFGGEAPRSRRQMLISSYDGGMGG